MEGKWVSYCHTTIIQKSMGKVKKSGLGDNYQIDEFHAKTQRNLQGR